jgi:dihydroorotase
MESAVAAAAAGGVTTVVALPDTRPPVDDPAMVEFVARRARLLRSVKVYTWAALTRNLDGRELAELGLLAEAGAVGATDADRQIADTRLMYRALAYASIFDLLVQVHPEDAHLARGGTMNAGELATRLGLPAVPAVAEVIAIERDLRLVEATGARLHIAHVTTAEAVRVIRAAKQRGLPVTCDVTPHHLLLTEQAVSGFRTYARVVPPLRREEDRLALIEGLADGTIDAIASDHSPQDQDSKRLPFAQAAPGSVGLETSLAATLELVHAGQISLLRAIDALARRPAEILRLSAGRLQPGAPADLVLFDPEAAWTVTEAGLHSLSRNTIFEGRTFRGRVLRTYVDGRCVFDAAARII